MVASPTIHFTFLCLGSQRVEFSGACQEATSGVPYGITAEIGNMHASK